MLKDNDAALIIGTRNDLRQRYLRIVDMAGLWRQHTGLGFVFAVWAVRNKDISRVADMISPVLGMRTRAN